MQRGCELPCSDKFRGDRREISGSFRNHSRNSAHVITLAVLGDQLISFGDGNRFEPGQSRRTFSGTVKLNESFCGNSEISGGDQEKVMSSSEGPQQGPVIPARQARQGVTGHNVRLVLGFSLAAIVIVFAMIWIVYFA
jgi:hypothetical protein